MKAQNNNSVQDQDGNSTKPLLSSRLLKFRAFSNETKKMMDWDFIKSVNNLTKLISLNHVDVSEFIGLHDKNGKEIYEGDILSYKFWHKEGIGSVVFQDGAFGISTYIIHVELYTFNPFCSYDEPEKDCYPFIEVVGNIYENPELIPNL